MKDSDRLAVIEKLLQEERAEKEVLRNKLDRVQVRGVSRVLMQP